MAFVQFVSFATTVVFCLLPSLSSSQTMVFFARRQVTLAAEMRLMMAYFSAFDGKRAWDGDVVDIAANTFHDDLIVVEGNERYNKEQFMAKLQAFVATGGSMEVHKLKQRQGLGISYELTFHKPGALDYPTKTFATFQDGKLVRVQREHVRKANTIL